jgi:uncharacterized integral membrane protein
MKLEVLPRVFFILPNLFSLILLWELLGAKAVISGMKIPPTTIILGIVALLLLIFIIQNALNSKAYIWVFFSYVTVPTGWLVLFATLIGMVFGWMIARGRTPKTPKQ